MITIKPFSRSIIRFLAVLAGYVRTSNRRRDSRRLTELDPGTPTGRWDERSPQIII